MKRRLLVQALSASATGLPALAPLSLLAQSAPWPSRPIRLVTPLPAGGSGDVMMREFATRLTARLGQPLVIESRPGANGTIAAQAVARSPADGYTLYWTLTQHIQVPVQYKNAGYDPINDFTPITRIGASVTLLVARPQLGIRNAADLVREAPRNKWSFGASAAGPQIVLEAFNKTRNLGMLGVNYKGEAAVLTDLLGGHVDIAIMSVSLAKQYVDRGELVALGISATRRATTLPQVATFQEQGYEDFNWIGWYCFLAPAGLPEDIAARLAREIKGALDEPDMVRKLDSMDVIVNWAERDNFREGMKRDMGRWAELVKRSGLTFD